jgi:hypothetical protein
VLFFREMGAMGARPRPRTAMQTERNSSSIKKRRGMRGIPLAVALFALAVIAVIAVIVFW